MDARLLSGGRRPHRVLAAAVTALFGLGLLACHGSPHSITFDVTTTTDGSDADPGDAVCEMTAGAGDCSLRAAVDEANASTELTPVIKVPPATYTLTIDGTDDDNASGDLDLDPPSGSALVISETLTGVVIDADGNDGALDLRSGHATVFGVSVTGATVAGLTVRAHNDSKFGWSASHHNAGAGVIIETTGVLTTTNVTISTNGAGGIQSGGWLETVFTTVTQNTGGGLLGGANNLLTTIVSDQATGPDCAGGVYSRGLNLDSDGSCLTAAENPSDIVGVSADLGPLSADAVPSHTPNPGSPAIDSVGFGPGASCHEGQVDQYLVERPVGPACDRGSIETTAI